MSKYSPLWQYIQNEDKDVLRLTFGQIEQIAGITVDHSFLRYKKELTDYGYQVFRISLKEETVIFQKL